MPRPRDFLARFRPVGTPGSAAAAGVPADRVAELGAELAPVLDGLEVAQAQAAAVRSAADADASRRRRDGEVRAAALVVASRERAVADRVAATTRARAEADEAVAAALDAAQAEAAAIADRVAQRLPGLLEQVRAAVRAEILRDTDAADVRVPGRRAGVP